MLLLTLILACVDKSEDTATEETVEDTAIVEDTSSETETEDTAEAQ